MFFNTELVSLQDKNQNMAANESAPCQKHDKPISSKNIAPRKRKIEQPYPKNTLKEVSHFTQ